MRKRKLTKGAAYHEAGHVVFRHLIGLPLVAVHISADGSGLTHGTGETITYTSQYDVWNYIAYTLAGPYAEARATHRARYLVFMFGGSDDHEAAEDALQWLVDHNYAKDYQSAWDRAERETMDCLREHWPAIERIALALLQKGRLETHEVVPLLTPPPLPQAH